MMTSNAGCKGLNDDDAPCRPFLFRLRAIRGPRAPAFPSGRADDAGDPYALSPEALATAASSALMRSRNLSRLRINAALLFQSA